MTLTSVTGYSRPVQASFHGLESINKVREAFRQRGQMDLVEGYKGMLIENFRCSKNFFTCVEVSIDLQFGRFDFYVYPIRQISRVVHGTYLSFPFP